MIKVRVEFEVPEEVYDQYEGLVQEFQENLYNINIEADIKEDDEIKEDILEYNDEIVKLYKSNYCSNNRLAVVMMDNELAPYGEVTVNLEDEELTNENCAFVDTNNMEGVDKFLIKNKLAKPTGAFGLSGFCVYPEFEFDMNKINEIYMGD